MDESNLERAKRFVKEHQTEIMAGAIVVLAVHNLKLRRDVEFLAGGIKDLAEGCMALGELSEKLIHSVENLDEDANVLFDRQSMLDNRLFEYGELINRQSAEIYKLQGSKSVFEEFFGEKK